MALTSIGKWLVLIAARVAPPWIGLGIGGQQQETITVAVGVNVVGVCKWVHPWITASGPIISPPTGPGNVAPDLTDITAYPACCGPSGPSSPILTWPSAFTDIITGVRRIILQISCCLTVRTTIPYKCAAVHRRI